LQECIAVGVLKNDIMNIIKSHIISQGYRDIVDDYCRVEKIIMLRMIERGVVI
jgi:hypothetical protein